ncbi:hypothetical protein SFRURICE_020276 [Spodoptera frugiperda]|nr:hypothetical protein SFRURICE_020276 [Spodoptera frugiperda]
MYWCLYNSANTSKEEHVSKTTSNGYNTQVTLRNIDKTIDRKGTLKPLLSILRTRYLFHDCLVGQVVASGSDSRVGKVTQSFFRFFKKISVVARNLELCPVYGNRLTPYYMGLITKLVKSGETSLSGTWISEKPPQLELILRSSPIGTELPLLVGQKTLYIWDLFFRFIILVTSITETAKTSFGSAFVSHDICDIRKFKL